MKSMPTDLPVNAPRADTSRTMGSMTADIISANLAPPAMAEPAQRLLAAISHRDVAELTGALRQFEAKALLDPAVSAYAGRWLTGVGKAHVPGLAQMVQMESVLGELKGSGDSLAVWVAQSWAETEGHQKLVQLAEAIIANWKDLHSEHATRFACALATSLAVIHTKVASRLMSRIESLDAPPKGLAGVIELAASWVDVGCVLTQLPPGVQSLIEERLANPDRRWEWSSPEASAALEELRPHLAVPSKAAKLFRTIIWEDVWPAQEGLGLEEKVRRPAAPPPAVAAKNEAPKRTPRSKRPAKKDDRKEEPVRLLMLVTLLLAMTLVYNCVNAQRQAAMQRPLSSASQPKPASQAAPFATRALMPGVS